MVDRAARPRLVGAGRCDVAPEQAVRRDAFYIENWSLAFDLYIILKTMSTVIERKGAY